MATHSMNPNETSSAGRGSITVSNRQKKFRIASSALKQVTSYYLQDVRNLESWDLSIAFLGPKQMAKWNETHLNHLGAADILTYNYLSPAELSRTRIFGELLICPQVAHDTAPNYNQHWTNEIVRYVVHGILHLLGYDDVDPEDRRIMKVQENRGMAILEQAFNLANVGRYAGHSVEEQ